MQHKTRQNETAPARQDLSGATQSPVSDTRPVLRFAPSPNGYLHLGHAYSALLNHRLAQEMGGRFLLRIEDIDTQRARPEYEAAVYEDLAWLGLSWEEPVMRQSERFAVYELALERLAARGLIYPCYCTRGEIAERVAQRPGWPCDPDGQPLYPGTCRNLSAEDQAQWRALGRYAARRIDMAFANTCIDGQIGWREFYDGAESRELYAESGLWGDAIVGRKDVPTSYHLAVVIDDAAQGVTDIVRGQDLFNATSLHRLLQVLLDLPEPHYHHHRLLTDDDGRKLSKSIKSMSLRQLRAEGVTPSDIKRQLGLL
ncbi:tRNA glutamyl-Q(34) synthetase GluQRS [Methylocella sp. CPCC 101449]|uniref:tRNA glutamyl-Q(34) synthetase GluQRS n=1 Tax=Methylocella sp. CPCC 101449 TaxID=2987531 RepID=UPI00288F7B07|nr:tRNA glutamyl-Q(34) synthetase GluQRS [Methylocella sp. CPCC 101449]MDT2023254.1 tRNA glutamyl-Q(34) synthetase GluQRS [Methylocella sp. CPCC 101449]